MMRREGKFAVWEGSGGGRYRRRGNRKGAGNGDPCQDYLVNIRLYRLSPKNKIYVNCLYNIISDAIGFYTHRKGCLVHIQSVSIPTPLGHILLRNKCSFSGGYPQPLGASCPCWISDSMGNISLKLPKVLWRAKKR